MQKLSHTVHKDTSGLVFSAPMITCDHLLVGKDAEQTAHTYFASSLRFKLCLQTFRCFFKQPGDRNSVSQKEHFSSTILRWFTQWLRYCIAWLKPLWHILHTYLKSFSCLLFLWIFSHTLSETPCNIYRKITFTFYIWGASEILAEELRVCSLQTCRKYFWHEALWTCKINKGEGCLSDVLLHVCSSSVYI